LEYRGCIKPEAMCSTVIKFVEHPGWHLQSCLRAKQNRAPEINPERGLSF